MRRAIKNLQEKKDQLKQEGQLTKEEESQFIREAFEIASCQKYMSDLFSGKTVEIKTYIKDAKIGTYAHEYYSTLESKFIEMMEKKIDAYAKDYTEIEEVYLNLNNKAKKIKRLENIATETFTFTVILSGVSVFSTFITIAIDHNPLVFALLLLPIPILAIGLTIAGIAWSKRVDAKVSLANKLEDYIVGSKQMEEATHTQKGIYPGSSLLEMDEDHILSRQSEVQSAMEHPDLSGMNRDNSLNVFQ